MRAAVLAVQGAFIEHEAMLHTLGVECLELRQKRDLDEPFDCLVLPGGESTVQGKLLRELDMLLPLRDKISAGMPVLATCAGLILLAAHIENDSAVHLGTLPVTVRRNGYGRQLGSFSAVGNVGTLRDVPLTFIRAPYITHAEDGVETLCVLDGKTVAVRYKNQIATAFHPELTGDTRIHEALLSLCK